MARGDARTPAAQRAATGDAASWDTCVERLLGPLITLDDREKRHHHALRLAAAALRAAGEHTLAANLLED